MRRRRAPFTALIGFVGALAGGTITGCAALPRATPAPTATPIPAALAEADAPPDGRTVTLGLALRQEMRKGRIQDRRVVCHVDLVVGRRIVGFYNARAPRRWSDRLLARYPGAFRERAWMEEHRPYYLDARAARAAQINGRRWPVVTIWIATRVTPEEAARIEQAIDARRGIPVRYRLIGVNCATRLGELLADAGWLPAGDHMGGMPGLDRPATLAHALARRAGTGRVMSARGWFTFTADGTVIIVPLTP